MLSLLIHFVSVCSTLTLKEYNDEHDNTGIPCTEKWYEHHSEPVIEDPEVIIIQGITIHIDKHIKTN